MSLNEIQVLLRSVSLAVGTRQLKSVVFLTLAMSNECSNLKGAKF